MISSPVRLANSTQTQKMHVSGVNIRQSRKQFARQKKSASEQNRNVSLQLKEHVRNVKSARESLKKRWHDGRELLSGFLQNFREQWNAMMRPQMNITHCAKKIGR